MNPFLSIVIPARDEEGSLPAVLAGVRSCAAALGLTSEMIVIDDASTDRTAQICQAAGDVLLIRHDKPMGCHPSTLEGFVCASGDWVLFLPADGQIPPSVMGPMLEAAKAGGLDAVVGVRTPRADPFLRRILSGGYAFLLRLLLGLKCRDVDSATLYRREPLQAVLPGVGSKSAAIAAEILLRMKASGGKSGEVEIPHLPRTSGKAKGVNLKDALGVPRNLFLLACLRLRG